MFNKEKLKEYLKGLNLEKGEYHLIAGASLLMHGMKDETEDIDMYISEKQFEKLKKCFDLKKSNKPYENLYELNSDVEVVVTQIKKEHIYYIEGVPCNSILEDYKWKKQHNREKDQEMIIKEEKMFEEIAKFYNCRVEQLTEKKIEGYIDSKQKDDIER